jgi:hypothetical protein
METITKCANRGMNTDWSLTGAETHAAITAQTGKYTRCGEAIQGFDEGWIPAVDRDPTCPRCLVFTSYEAVGFKDISTGGGCEAFSAEDPNWEPPAKVIQLAGPQRPNTTPIRIATPEGALHLTWPMFKQLEERIRSIRDHAVIPYVLVTASLDASLPMSLDEVVDVGYYDGNGNPAVWVASVKDSHTFFRAWQEMLRSHLSVEKAMREVANAQFHDF